MTREETNRFETENQFKTFYISKYLWKKRDQNMRSDVYVIKTLEM